MRWADRPIHFDDPAGVAEAILQRTGDRILLALPLGLGKAVHIANALYERAAATPSVSLRIITALTLSRPRSRSELEQRFLAPVIERAFGDYPELAYVEPMRRSALPPNIEVNEFFLQAPDWLDAPLAQQSYISANYTHAIPLILSSGVNVVAQLVAKREAGGIRYSLSGNTDVTLEMLAARRAGKADFLLIGQVNSELPFMGGDAELDPDEFDFVLEGVEFALPAPPRRPIADSDHAMGLHIASLIPDGGTLQIGIGSLGHAVAQSLILRHRHPHIFAELLSSLAGPASGIERHTAPFETGLYALSEMFNDALLELFRAGILKREVNGGVLDAAFFLGPRDFYRALRELPETERAKLRMRAVTFVNDLHGDDQAARAAQRVGARFINNGMMATLLGAIISDGLEDGRVVSGVGGQYNFVAQAFALDGARAIVAVPATRAAKGKTSSNIRWSYGHSTIPRHLRDVVVTEYGVADLRGRTDAQVIASMLAIADSRHQDELLHKAKQARKAPTDATLSAAAKQNFPERIGEVLARARQSGWLSDLPFGDDYTETERTLMPALSKLSAAAHSPLALTRIALEGLRTRSNAQAAAALERLKLNAPRSLREHIYAALVRGAMARTGDAGQSA